MYVSEFVAQLEYHLSQMAAKNDHHRFEKLCVEVARRRIATNIFVATGPVGSGGDGGRDGETFDTALPHEVATWFSVRATTASVAVACSTGDYKKRSLWTFARSASPETGNSIASSISRRKRYLLVRV